MRTTVMATGGKRKSYCLKRNLEVLEYANEHSVSAAAKKFSVDRCQVQLWRKNKAAIESVAGESASSQKRQHLPGAGRKEVSEQLNTQVYDWIVQSREKQQPVSRRLIRLKAMEIAASLVQSGDLETH